jgi:OOP family OmpA-OmpF porin
MRKLLLTAAFVVAGAAAHATDGVYVGAGLGQANVDNIFDSDFSLHPHDVAWKAAAGFRPIDWFAVEANYFDFGSQTKNFGLGTASADAKAFAAYGMALLPVQPMFDLYAKAGVARWQLDGNIRGEGQLFAFSDRGTQVAYGGGLQANFGPFAARLEYDGFQVRHTDGIAMYTAGVVWTFL